MVSMKGVLFDAYFSVNMLSTVQIDQMSDGHMCLAECVVSSKGVHMAALKSAHFLGSTHSFVNLDW